MNEFAVTIFTGIGATVVMDLWGVARRPLLGIAPPNYALVGRWVGHMTGGRFHHDSITAAAPVPGESAVGWTIHYLTGILFAALLVGLWGTGWLRQPTIVPALVVGIGTVVAPFFLMQPGMGAGIAGSRTPRPNATRLQSLVTHAVFGLGLYVAARGLGFLYAL